MIIVLIRTQLRSDVDEPAYHRLDARMFELVQSIPGFLSARSYRSDDGDAISLIRFASADALRAWRDHPEHRETQRRGREEFFAAYDVEVCEVTRAYDFGRAAPHTRTGDT
jgi:heme-degrading monooxygenase HmoA